MSTPFESPDGLGYFCNACKAYRPTSEWRQTDIKRHRRLCSICRHKQQTVDTLGQIVRRLQKRFPPNKRVIPTWNITREDVGYILNAYGHKSAWSATTTDLTIALLDPEKPFCTCNTFVLTIREACSLAGLSKAERLARFVGKVPEIRCLWCDQSYCLSGMAEKATMAEKAAMAEKPAAKTRVADLLEVEDEEEDESEEEEEEPVKEDERRGLKRTREDEEEDTYYDNFLPGLTAAKAVRDYTNECKQIVRNKTCSFMKFVNDAIDSSNAQGRRKTSLPIMTNVTEQEAAVKLSALLTRRGFQTKAERDGNNYINYLVVSW